MMQAAGVCALALVTWVSSAVWTAPAGPEQGGRHSMIGAPSAAGRPASMPSYLLVNVEQARLWMVRDGRIEGSMRVVVGRAEHPTPVLGSEVTHVVLNPRWNVPADIVRASLAPAAAETGGRSLADAGYEVMSGWADDARPVDAATVDWRAVSRGDGVVAVRQAPGPGNAMGKAKFVMPNDLGIYLHDTPDRTPFTPGSNRRGSAGCVRLEDYRALLDFLAPDLPPAPSSDRPTYVRLADPVPIYLTRETTLDSRLET